MTKKGRRGHVLLSKGFLASSLGRLHVTHKDPERVPVFPGVVFPSIFFRASGSASFSDREGDPPFLFFPPKKATSFFFPTRFLVWAKRAKKSAALAISLGFLASLSPLDNPDETTTTIVSTNAHNTMAKEAAPRTGLAVGLNKGHVRVCIFAEKKGGRWRWPACGRRWLADAATRRLSTTAAMRTTGRGRSLSELCLGGDGC